MVNQDVNSTSQSVVITSEEAQRYVRMALNYISGALISHGVLAANATWVEPSIGITVGVVSLIWSIYGNRINAKISELAKRDPAVKIITDHMTAEAIPQNNVMSKDQVKVVSK